MSKLQEMRFSHFSIPRRVCSTDHTERKQDEPLPRNDRDAMLPCMYDSINILESKAHKGPLQRRPGCSRSTLIRPKISLNMSFLAFTRIANAKESAKRRYAAICITKPCVEREWLGGRVNRGTNFSQERFPLCHCRIETYAHRSNPSRKWFTTIL